MRGKDASGAMAMYIYRITPAYAGKSSGDVTARICLQDHPRLCGEKFQNLAGSDADPGSPPPMRGKVVHFLSDDVAGGITPAYAGKSRK